MNSCAARHSCGPPEVKNLIPATILVCETDLFATKRMGDGAPAACMISARAWIVRAGEGLVQRGANARPGWSPPPSSQGPWMMLAGRSLLFLSQRSSDSASSPR